MTNAICMKNFDKEIAVDALMCLKYLKYCSGFIYPQDYTANAGANRCFDRSYDTKKVGECHDYLLG
jgi:hypothetical protein